MATVPAEGVTTLRVSAEPASTDAVTEIRLTLFKTEKKYESVEGTKFVRSEAEAGAAVGF